MKYLLHEYKTGETIILNFQDTDFDLSVKARGIPPTLKQAEQQLSIWNRAQLNYKSEFNYSLIYD
jgi:hypothetical protein